MATTALSAETRTRILDTAFARVRDRGTSAISVKAIAAEAGVSRQLIYFHFHSRAGLLTAMARHHDRASGFLDQLADSARLEAVDALEALLRAWCAYLPEILPVARALEAAHVTGDEGGTAWRDRMDGLWDALRRAVGRIADDGRLAADSTPDTATDWIWSRIQPSTYAHLVDERDWSPDQYTEHTIRSLMRELVTVPR
jgi:AcrR family transcriptional regulator